MSSPKPVLFGGSGKLGTALLERDPRYLHPSSTDVDITRSDRVSEYLRDVGPPLVIHAAAVVGRREADEDRERAYRVNVRGTRNISRACRDLPSRLVYISSAAIFDGEAGRYGETDLPGPRYFYGWTKLLGEQSVAMTPHHVIVRTDFFVPGRSKYRDVFVDHFCSKLPVEHLARAVTEIAASDFTGVIHVGGERKSLYDLMSDHVPRIRGVRIADSAMPDFPRDLSLDTSLYDRLFGWPGSPSG